MSAEALPRFDGCLVVKRLRSGPVADLFHALQQPLGRPVLIKALSPSILPTSPFAATVEREARVLSALHHAGIPHLYDFVRRDDRMWLVLEWVDGSSLDEVVQRSGSLPPAVVAAVALALSRALEHAHERGVVHRDVQPRNVMISRQGEVKLMNFSVAVDEELSSMPELFDASGFGGPSYLSPEQILGEAPDPRSDLFSLGVVVYELLTGHRPFDGPDDRATTQRIRHDPPPPLARRQLVLPAAFERLVHKLLAKLPSDRPESARDVALELGQILAELDVGDVRAAILAWLERTGGADAPRAREAHAPPQLAHPGAEAGRALRGLYAFGALIVIGGIAIQLAASKSGAAPAPRESRRLELAPEKAGYLRVVAEPWAYVVVDGQRVETTPFARALPLEPGEHYVRLEHPSAPTERRTINVAAGETVQLDVSLRVAYDAGVAGPAAPDAGSDAPVGP